MNNDSELILVLAPTVNDSAVAANVLKDAGLGSAIASSVEVLCSMMENGCGVLVIAEEALPAGELPSLQSCLSKQEPWSDIPIILLTGQGTATTWESFSASGNIAILERPFSRLTFVRAVEVALRSRRKQYQVKHLLEEQDQAAKRRDEFLATLSHELRTPLNVLLGWIEILSSGVLTSEAQVEALNVLERNARLQKSLIDDLLDTSRIITGKLHFETAPVALNMLLQNVHTAFLPRAHEKNILFTLENLAEDCLVMADEQRLSQVISNLVTNAIKFTPEKGTIAISLMVDGDSFKMSIKDSGQGIEPAFLPYVFDRLKQEDMSTTRSHGGLGLGLAISAHIVEQHNAKIEAKSAGRGKGAEFILTIPRFKGPEANLAKSETAVKLSSLEGLRILVLDDSNDILQLINLWLKRSRAEVKLVSSGEEALRILPSYVPDIVLSDIGMPEMDGYEFIRRVRAHPDKRVSQVSAIALTAYAKDEERTRALEAGFQMHISKPISNKQLVSAVTALAGRNQIEKIG